MTDPATSDARRAVFNLIDEPWLPMRRRSGVVEHVQPWRVTEGITDDPFTALAWPRPDFNGAAHELLIGLLSTAATPEDDEEWENWWREPPRPDVLRERFAVVAQAFNLDGPGPRFLQDFDTLEGAEDKEIATLLIDAPGAQTLRNNVDLFVKRGGAPVLSRAAAAMALFTLNAFAPAGGAGFRTSLRGGGPMTTLVIADHPEYAAALWGRLWPNVESREQIETRATGSKLDEDPGTVFPWCIPTRTSDSKAGGRATTPADVHPLHVYWGMPRRIRLLFEDAEDRRCGLTDARDSVIVPRYRTRNYGSNYSDGFQHPLTPYYRPKAASAEKLAVHPNPGGISYRLWPGIVVPTKDNLREPAQVVRQWQQERSPRAVHARFVAFGYDMDNMKARAWLEGEMPLWHFDDDVKEWLCKFIQRATAGADTVTRLVTGAVKSALYDRPKDADGDYGFVAERFYRDTEAEFYAALGQSMAMIQADPDSDDPTMEVCQRWAPVMETAALRLFDEYAPSDGLENRDMRRYVKARFYLTLALRGHGKNGKSLFERLGIPSPESSRPRGRKKETA